VTLEAGIAKALGAQDVDILQAVGGAAKIHAYWTSAPQKS